MELSGRVAVITGASRGIGAGLAMRFAARGLRLGLCARSAPALAAGPDVVARTVDVTDAGATQAFCEAVEERFGAIDLWINNAGVLEPIAPLRETAPEAFARHVEVNLGGVFLGARTYVQHLRRVGAAGVLINLSSGAATKPYHGWSAYCASKAAVEQLTRCLDLEERDHGLRAHAVAPGVVDTAMQALVRASDEADFPDVGRFRRRKEEGDFNGASYVADEFLKIAFDPASRPADVVARIPDEPRRTGRPR